MAMLPSLEIDMAYDGEGRQRMYLNGEDVSEGEAEVLGTRFSESFPDAEISVVCGGQPVYYYMVSIE